MELDYIPKVCKGEDAKYSGKVRLTIPSYSERMAYSNQVGMRISAEGEVDFGDSGITGIMSKAAKDIEKHITYLEIQKGETVHKSYKTMSEDPTFDAVTQDLTNLMLGGFKLGED